MNAVRAIPSDKFDGACRLVGIDPKTVRREPAPDCPEIRARMREIAAEWHRFSILAVIEDCTRESLGLVANTSISRVRVARELDALILLYGKPATVVSDNGTELTSRATLDWQNDTGVQWHYIARAKPTQNTFIESFNGK